MPPGWHTTTGPAAIIYNPENTAKGQYRLESEYGAPSRLEPSPWQALKWLPAGLTSVESKALKLPSDCRLADDADGQPVVLFPSTWTMDYFKKSNPGVPLFDLSADAQAAAALASL